MTDAVAIEEEPVPTKKLAISPDLKLPLDAVTRRIGILGMSGSGKTTTAAVFTEEILKQQLPTAIVDPKDDFWGLRSSRDGKSEGLPINVLGGEHGDAPLEETAGKLIADMLVDEAPQLVLSMAHFSKSAMKRFATDFFERLYHRNREALNVIVDEADLFAPQKVQKGDALRLFGALDDLVRRGRKRGIGVTMICQRSSIINKDILTQCELLIAHRASHPLDIDPVVTWMRAARMPEEKLAQVENTIAALADGEAWVMSPHWLEKFARVQIRDRETFDSSATPEAGKRRVEPKVLAKVDLELLTQKMAETIERAKATDPKLLRQRVAELERQLATAAKERPAPAPAKEKRVEVPVLKDSQIKRLENALGRLDKLSEAGVKYAQDLSGAWGTINGVGEALVNAMRAVVHPAPIPAPPHLKAVPPPRASPPPPRRAEPPAELNGELTDYAQLLLTTIAERYPMKLTTGQVAALSGRSARSSAFDHAMAALRKAGFIEKGGRHAILTDAGRAAAGAVEPHGTTPEELQASWLQVLPDYERALLKALLEAGAPLTHEQLGERARKSVTSSAFDHAMASLKRNGLVVVDAGEIRPTEELRA